MSAIPLRSTLDSHARRRRLPRWKKPSVLPGFGLTMGYTIFYLTILVLIPFSALILKATSLPVANLWRIISDPRVVASYRLTLSTSLVAAVLAAAIGAAIAWSLVRYRFPGRKLIDSLIDLPFALPTAVSGIALTTLYAKNGWIGKWLEPIGIQVAYTPIGITVALVFIGLPFVVRTLQPAIEELDRESEEAAHSLGASRWTTLLRVTLPSLLPSWLTGVALAFARALGEYGSIVFIAGNMPMKTEITSLLIITKLEQYDYIGATAIALVMLIASFFMLLAINALQWWTTEGKKNRGLRA